MMMHTAEEVTAKIHAGKTLFIAGDERALVKLPRGNWVGGTIPYFMGDNGGEFTQDKVYVTELPDYMLDVAIKRYDENTISDIYRDIPGHGLALVVMPASSRTHLSFALNGPTFDGFATRPLLGWVTGVFLDELGKVKPKIFNGLEPAAYEEGALVMHATLPSNKVADIDIINIFEQGTGDSILFPETGFSVTDAVINGTPRNFADYVIEKNLDTKLPLVADYHGALVNISFQSIDTEKKVVHFYAPVFKNVEYKQTAPVDNYVKKFSSSIPATGSDTILFSCNCILNYLYSELEGKKTAKITGPITFGEIAYQLLNQTLVYVNIHTS